MRWLLLFFALPLGSFWGWYFLSLNDINFGSIYLSRALHDLVFELYGEMLGVDPDIIPGMIAKACAFDMLIVAAIWAFRRRADISAWFAARRRSSTEDKAFSAGAAAGPARLEG